MSMLVVLADY